jgi:hypothetical protein
VGGLEGTLVAATAEPVLETVATAALTRHRARGQRVLNVAAGEARMTPQELLERILADERLLDLAAAVVAAATQTALEAKIRALGQALARGTLAEDDAVIDTEHFMVSALAALETPHLRVLNQVAGRYEGYGEPRTADGRGQAHGWTFEVLRERLPGLRLVLRPVLSALTANALIFDTAVGTWGYSSGKSERWIATDYGRRVLRLLEEAGVEDADRPDAGF